MAEVQETITFNSTGGKPGPARAALLAKARQHLKDPWMKYAIEHIHDPLRGVSGGFRDHALMGRSRAEVLVAYFDFLNKFCPTVSGCDFYSGVDDIDGLDWLFDSVVKADGVCLREIPATRSLHYVPELQEN